MQNDTSGDVSGWLKRYHAIERTNEQLLATAQTADVFCASASTAVTAAPFESEPSQFFALLHDLAPSELKK